MTFAAALNAEMDRQQHTQADVARETGIDRAVISRYCNAQREPALAQFAVLTAHYPRLLLWLVQEAFTLEKGWR